MPWRKDLEAPGPNGCGPLYHHKHGGIRAFDSMIRPRFLEPVVLGRCEEGPRASRIRVRSLGSLRVRLRFPWCSSS